MGEVDNHSYAIHLANHLAANIAHPPPEWLCFSERIFKECGIGVDIVTIVGQSGIADTKLVEESEV